MFIFHYQYHLQCYQVSVVIVCFCFIYSIYQVSVGDFNEKMCKRIYICLAENNEFIFEPSRVVGVIV